MKRRIPLLLFLALTTAASALSPVFANREAGEYRGKEYVIDIDRNGILALPNWRPEMGDPKISPAEAWKRARARIRTLLPDVGEFETDAILLMTVGSAEGKRFVYIIGFTDPKTMSSRKGDIETPNQLSVWVSTDGSVFLPRLSKGKGDEYVF